MHSIPLHFRRKYQIVEYIYFSEKVITPDDADSVYTTLVKWCYILFLFPLFVYFGFKLVTRPCTTSFGGDFQSVTILCEKLWILASFVDFSLLNLYCCPLVGSIAEFQKLTFIDICFICNYFVLFQEVWTGPPKICLCPLPQK